MKLIKQEITLPPLFGVTEEAEAQRNDLVFRAVTNAVVTNPVEQNSAVEAARDIRGMLRDVEDTRTALKKPLLDAGRLLDSLAKDFTAPLSAELGRIERLVTDFQQVEDRRVALAEQQRREDYERLAAERLAAEGLARAASSAMLTESDLDRALRVEAEMLRAHETLQALITAPPPEKARATGASTRRVVRWEVLDVRALYAARPELCTLEAKASAINATCFPEMPVAGLRLWWEDKTTIRRA